MGDRARGRLPPEVNRILYVRNLPFGISTEELFELFGKYGAVRQIRLCAAFPPPPPPPPPQPQLAPIPLGRATLASPRPRPRTPFPSTAAATLVAVECIPAQLGVAGGARARALMAKGPPQGRQKRHEGHGVRGVRGHLRRAAGTGAPLRLQCVQ